MLFLRCMYFEGALKESIMELNVNSFDIRINAKNNNNKKRLLNFTDVIKYVQVFGKYVCGPIQLGTKKPWVTLAKTVAL